jgi:hypothetical protein
MNSNQEGLKCIVRYKDLSILRIAARRWAKEHPENPNAQTVLTTTENVHDSYDWIKTDDEKVK